MGSTDNFLPGNVKAEFVAVACSAAAADPDTKPVEVAKVGATLWDLDWGDPTPVGLVGTGTVDAPLTPVGMEDGATGVGTEVGTEDEEVGTGTADDEADDAEVDARGVVTEADDGEITVAVGLDEAGLIELDVGTGAWEVLGRGTEGDCGSWDANIDEGFVPEPMGLGTAIATVQVLTSRTASFPWSSLIGVRTITQVWVTGPEPVLIVWTVVTEEGWGAACRGSRGKAVTWTEQNRKVYSKR
jgi:hypothetical protein